MRRPLVSCGLSVALGAFLIVYLLAHAKLDLHATEELVRGISPVALVEVTLLFALYNVLGAEKWRLIDRHLAPSGSRGMTRLLYFGFTAIGAGLGQIMPVQLSLLLSRSIGAHLHGGRGLVRGGAGVALDQLFDIMVAIVLAIASIAVLTFGGGALAWLLVVAILAVAVAALYGKLVVRLTRGAEAVSRRVGGRIGRWCAAIALSPLLAPGIGLRLAALSVVRFLLLVLIAGVGARATGGDVTLWQLAASIPFAIFANAIAITPGGLGINEWTMSTALVAFGASFHDAAQWAVVNRVLVATAAVLGGIAGAAIVILLRWVTGGSRIAAAGAPARLIRDGDASGN